MQDFRNLDVWKKSHELMLAVYRASRSFPDDERFGLTSQLRRATASIPANLAEGCGRGSDADFGRFVQNAMGSSSEVEYHFLLARDLTYLNAEDYAKLNDDVTRIKRMLASLLRKIKGN
ncbi:MAG: four helix bundle protein [Planctomycetes bacterium]|nr:four helix bundle protein [Planctomycetota bacterium]